jgi:hypothetical protein
MSNTQEAEKPSKTRQWQERSEAPIAVRAMTPQQIKEFKEHLIASYKCEPGEIDYTFEKITDADDTDRDDCLWLKYTMRCVIAGKPSIREIFRLKLPIPEDIKKTSDNLRKEQLRRRKPAALTNGDPK